MKENEIRNSVRQSYGKIAATGGSCCSSGGSCCAGNNTANAISKAAGYSAEEIGMIPEGANLGLGCGNPVAVASLKAGEVVLDLGSGAGFDCFLASERVGKTGRVIGVDMTPEMVDKARNNAVNGGYINVEFRLGEIENLPIGDSSIDVIISNCVINLSPDKPRVFAEAYRVLKPGGRLMVSDIVLLKAIPEDIKNSIEAYVACIAGAIKKEEYLAAVELAGFSHLALREEKTYPVDGAMSSIADSIASISLSACKPLK